MKCGCILKNNEVCGVYNSFAAIGCFTPAGVPVIDACCPHFIIYYYIKKWRGNAQLARAL